MTPHTKKKYLIISMFIVGIFAAACSTAPTPASPTNVDSFAKCLTEKNVKMYGAFWCPKCSKQKKLFGESFQYVNYVECDPRGENEQSSLCIEKNVEGYPDWEFSDGTRIEKVMELSELAEQTGCVLQP